MSDRVRTSWRKRSWLLGALIAVGVVLLVLNIWDQDWLGLAATALALVVVSGLWASLRRQPRDRSVQPPSA